MDRLCVRLADKPYDIFFNDSFSDISRVLQGISAPKRLMVVTDSNVEGLYLAELCRELESGGYDVCSHTFAAGEESKTMQTILDICAAAMKNRLDRGSMLVALGGGVVGDMTGFAAAIYMRGIDFVQIPTTLLSQTDSSVGGKTGVDFGGAKNILGAFHQPRAVYINTETLKTLPPEQIVSGMGEIIKHALIRDVGFFDFLCRSRAEIQALNSAAMQKAIRRSCEIKARVVAADEKESGERKDLNFGHTIGHAVEGAMNFKLTHGECVALGMLAAAKISLLRGIIGEAELERLRRLLTDYGFKTTCPIPDAKTVTDLIAHDKKAADGRPDFILPSAVGTVFRTRDVSDEEISAALSFISE